jgi:predicted dehydrogenase
MNRKNILTLLALLVLISCNNDKMKNEVKPVRLVTLDPGHFHAALVQKTMYDDVDSVVHVYAPTGNDLQLHLDRINGYNNRKENPTHWKEEVYTGDDFFDKMIKEKKGNVVVLSGNNQKKSEYILQSLQNGFNVLADKPMAIDSKGFEQLKQAFDITGKNNLLLYDIMTERFEITTILQRELSMIPEIFGTLEQGTADNPAVTMESGHCFYKYVSGNVLTRPTWFMDISQQGEGIADVSTHLVDLVQWECFPEQQLDYIKDITIDSAKRWPTNMTVSQFNTITHSNGFPDFLRKNVVKDSILQVYSNGEINYQLKGVHARVKVQWDYTNAGQTDTHHSILRGTKANLIVRQGPEEQYKPTLYIEFFESNKDFDPTETFKKIQAKYPGVELRKIIGLDDWLGSTNKWEVFIPDKYKEGHEAHFARVTKNFLEYLKNKNMPAWEVPDMLAKYYTTTKALELAKQK